VSAQARRAGARISRAKSFAIRGLPGGESRNARWVVTPEILALGPEAVTTDLPAKKTRAQFDSHHNAVLAGKIATRSCAGARERHSQMRALIAPREPANAPRELIKKFKYHSWRSQFRHHQAGGR
jgi:hypothetical protein